MEYIPRPEVMLPDPAGFYNHTPWCEVWIEGDYCDCPFEEDEED